VTPLRVVVVDDQPLVRAGFSKIGFLLKDVAADTTRRLVEAFLPLGETTVKTNVGRLLAKLDARDRVALVITAYEEGLVEP
jgi:hypothetical protein